MRIERHKHCCWVFAGRYALRVGRRPWLVKVYRL